MDQNEPSSISKALADFFGPINKGFQNVGFKPPDPQTGVPPADYEPLAIALGLLHPRLGGAFRDMGMASRLSGQGSTPAVMQGMPTAARNAPGPEMGMISNAYSPRPGNSNAPAVIHPQKGPVAQPAANSNYNYLRGIFD